MNMQAKFFSEFFALLIRRSHCTDTSIAGCLLPNSILGDWSTKKFDSKVNYAPVNTEKRELWGIIKFFIFTYGFSCNKKPTKKSGGNFIAQKKHLSLISLSKKSHGITGNLILFCVNWNFETVTEALPQLSCRLLEQMMTTDQKEKAGKEQEHPGTDSCINQGSTVTATRAVKQLSRTINR